MDSGILLCLQALIYDLVHFVVVWPAVLFDTLKRGDGYGCLRLSLNWSRCCLSWFQRKARSDFEDPANDPAFHLPVVDVGSALDSNPASWLGIKPARRRGWVISHGFPWH